MSAIVASKSRLARSSAAIPLIAALACSLALSANPARADQGGVSFWLPGAFGSLAATPLVPGWSLGAIYLHSSMVGRRQCGSVAGDRLPQ